MAKRDDLLRGQDLEQHPACTNVVVRQLHVRRAHRRGDWAQK
jgi:hypothetical protein